MVKTGIWQQPEGSIRTLEAGGWGYKVATQSLGTRKGGGKIPRLILSIFSLFRPRAELSLDFCQVMTRSQLMTHSLFSTPLGSPRACSVMILPGAAWGGLGHFCQECALPPCHAVLI